MTGNFKSNAMQKNFMSKDELFHEFMEVVYSKAFANIDKEMELDPLSTLEKLIPMIEHHAMVKFITSEMGGLILEQWFNANKGNIGTYMSAFDLGKEFTHEVLFSNEALMDNFKAYLKLLDTSRLEYSCKIFRDAIGETTDNSVS